MSDFGKDFSFPFYGFFVVLKVFRGFSRVFGLFSIFLNSYFLFFEDFKAYFFGKQ